MIYYRDWFQQLCVLCEVRTEIEETVEHSVGSTVNMLLKHRRILLFVTVLIQMPELVPVLRSTQISYLVIYLVSLLFIAFLPVQYF